MTYTSEVLADAPLAYYRLGEASGTTMGDSSGNSRNGTYSGSGVTLGATGLLTSDADTAATWGAGGLGSVTYAAWMAPTAFTLEAIIKPSSFPSVATIIARKSGIGPWALRIDSGKLALWVLNAAANSWQITTYGTNLVAGTTYHVAATRTSGGAVTLYVNGVSVQTGTAATLWADTELLRIGGVSTGETFLGVIDEAAVYGTALSGTRIADHYAAATASPPAIELDVAAMMPRWLAAFDLLGPIEALVDAEMPRWVADFAVNVPPQVSVDAEVPRWTAAFDLNVPPQLYVEAQTPRWVATFTARAEIPIVPPPLVAAPGMSVVIAKAHGPVTMHGTQPVYSVTQAQIPRARQRVIVDGLDVTYFRGVPIPEPSYTLLEPLLYGPGSFELPQIAACFEKFGSGDLWWLRHDAPVEIQRVIDDPDNGPQVVGIDYKGFIVAFDTAGRTLSVELGGEANGRAAMRDWQVPVFPRINDLGRQGSNLIQKLGLPFEPYLGPVTGIEVMTTGGVGHLEQIETVIGKAWTRAGRQWTIMPDDFGVYRMRRKDDTTIHATVFFDDARTVPNLRRDKAEEPNRIYSSAVAPNGMRINGAVYPGLVQGKPPPFPGHMEQGDTGPGVRMLILKLQGIGYLKLADAPGGYDDDVYQAVVELQKDAGLFDDGFTTPTVPGEVNQLTWDALYDLDVTTLSIEGSHIEPMAQRSKVREWNRSGSGNIKGPNPNYDPSVVPVDRTIQMGQAGMNASQVREASRAELREANDPNWVGTIVFNTGALIRGEKAIGATLTAGDVMDARELKPGMNIWAPAFDGGTLFHVAACERASGAVTATVDTRFRDAMEVWEILIRNRESRSDPTRSRARKHRSSTLVKDSIGEWDQIGGLLNQDVDLEIGWNVFEVVAAQEGTIARLKITTNPPAEFVVAVFGERIGPGTLMYHIGNPLTKAGSRAWSKQVNREVLEDDFELLYVGGDDRNPCGYWPKKATERNDDNDNKAPLTGRWKDDAGFTYRSRVSHLVWVAVWSDRVTTIDAGRIMWPQLEAGV